MVSPKLLNQEIFSSSKLKLSLQSLEIFRLIEPNYANELQFKLSKYAINQYTTQAMNSKIRK